MTDQPRTRYTRRIEVGTFEEKIGFTLHFDEGCEHFLFQRDLACDLALKLLRVAELTRAGAGRSTGP